MVSRMKDRVRVYHTGTVGTSPEAWARKLQPELRAAISSLSNDKALAANALGRWEGMATHQVRVEYHESVVVNALLHDAITDTHYLVLGVTLSNKRNAQGDPDHLVCAVSVQKPAPTVR
jgi:hypothetical protein